jgi:glycosyltransferase involved in cell wall biosynthesis
MNKPLILITGPVLTRSGYGDRTRDIARAIIKADKYDLRIWPINWGITPFIGLNEKDPSDAQILNCILKTPELHKKPDIHIHISVPSEFQPVGTYNIGITAGIETDIVDSSWIEGVNRMDLTLVSSEHSKKGFMDARYEQRDERTNAVINTLFVQKPIEVLFEGLDIETFFKTDDINDDLDNELKAIPEKDCFLFVGHWLSGDLGQDRKDVGMLIKIFYESFKNKKNRPALILKTSGGSTSIGDRKAILDKIDAVKNTCSPDADLPNIYLLHGDLTREEMNSLYNHPKVKAHISFTKGEGYGRPLLEASVSAKPIIVPKNSGYVDFLEHVIWLPGQLTPIHPSAQWQGVLNSGTKWFTVDYSYAGGIMRDVFENPKKYTDLGKRQAYKSRTEFTLDKMGEKLLKYVDDAIDKMPKPVQLKLPQLKKIELPKLKKVELEDGK